jgi:hypothetical protein
VYEPQDFDLRHKCDYERKTLDRASLEDAGEEERTPRHRPAKMFWGRTVISFVEKNPFGKFIIKQPLVATLAALDRQLS